MKKFASVIIIAMILAIGFSTVFNILSAESLPSEGSFFENIEAAFSENLPFRKELSELMDGINYLSGVRHFGNIYIGSEGSLLQEIERPTSRNFSAAKNFILSFAERNQQKPYFMLVPTSIAILHQEIDNFALEDIFNQRNMINRMYSEFDGAVRTTDIFQTLYDHRSEYIYYHTENIPTSLGGYYIYGELCSRLGIEQTPLDAFSIAYGAHGFYGSLATDFLKQYSSSDFVSLYEYNGGSVILERRENNGSIKISESLFVYSEEAFEDKTDMIFGGISPVMEITSAESLGERSSILIFGDESAKSWLPFLVSNYGRITFVDLDSASETLLSSVTATEYDQILFAYSTFVFSKGINFEKLEFIG